MMFGQTMITLKFLCVILKDEGGFGDPIYNFFGKTYINAAKKLVKDVFNRVEDPSELKKITAKIKDKKPDSLVKEKPTHFEIIKPNKESYTEDELRDQIDVPYDNAWSPYKQMEWVLNHFDQKGDVKRAQKSFGADVNKYLIKLYKEGKKDELSNLEKLTNKDEIDIIAKQMIEEGPSSFTIQKGGKTRKYQKNSQTHLKAIVSPLLKMYRLAGKPDLGFKANQAAFMTRAKDILRRNVVPYEIRQILDSDHLRSTKIGLNKIANFVY